MKVLFVCSGNDIGGQALSFEELSFEYEQALTLKKAGIEVDHLLIIGGGVIGYIKNYVKLLKLLRKTNFDLIHAHYGLSGFISVLQFQKPVVITFHGSDINNKFINIFSSIAALLSNWNVFVTKKLSDKIILKTRNKETIIPCGIDLEAFYPIEKSDARKKTKFDIDERIVIFSSSIQNTVKNYPLAKAAIELIDNCRLVELKGYSRVDVNFLLNASDALLLTSFTEGSPQIIKEAMSCNIPIVATDVGDIKKIIEGTNYCYITKFDAREIADKLKFILQLCPRTNGHERVKKFDNKSTANELINVYQKVLMNYRKTNTS